MNWYINKKLFNDAWQAADFVTDGANIKEAASIAYNLECMYDNEESEVNGYRVTSYLIFE